MFGSTVGFSGRRIEWLYFRAEKNSGWWPEAILNNFKWSHLTNASFVFKQKLKVKVN